MSQKCFLLLTFVTVSLEQCARSTFQYATVEISQGNRYSAQVIEDCISPEQIIYRSGENLEIILTGASVPVLQKGAISNIQENFTLTFLDGNIETIDEGAFSNLPYLHRVDIKYGNTKIIEPENFQNMDNLFIIVIENNKIEYFSDGTFSNLPNLREVSVHQNRLRHFTQHWFIQTPNLEFLSLSGNLITYITKSAFNTLPNLSMLALNGNLIETIHKNAFKGLKKLSYLFLSHNKLKVLDIEFYSRLGRLTLQCNNITYISDEKLQILPDFEMTVTLNPLQCSCFHRLLRWSDDNNITLGWKSKDENPVCVVPKTNEFRCIERKDHDFYEGYHLHFSKGCN